MISGEKPIIFACCAFCKPRLATGAACLMGAAPRPRPNRGCEAMPTVEPNRAFLAAVMAARNSLPFGQRPTDLHVRVAAKLAFWRSAHPSHRSLARAAKCSRRTVRRALARLRDLGLMTWCRRVLVGRGWRARIANGYVFSSRPLSSTSLKSIKILSSATLSPSGTQPPSAGLAEVAERRRAVLAAAWRARKAA
jgi:hypothetical protein